MKELENENECTTCGDKCYLKQCTNCWEVERRLKDYMKSRKGQMFVYDVIHNLAMERLKR